MSTTKAVVQIVDNKLIVTNQTILSDIPNNISFTSSASSGPVDGDALFIGASCHEENSTHIVSLGTLRDVTFLACFQFRLWWMTYKTGSNGRDVPLETQFLLIKSSSTQTHEHDNSVYTVFLPLIEGPFRACLQGTSQQDHLHLCLESGDSHTKASTFTHSLLVSAGTDPFAALSSAVSTAKHHLQTFRQRHEKRLPGIVDLFGWCTWDAFYEEVTPEGIEEGLKSLSSGGFSPKFMIIDDGWQSVDLDEDLEDQVDDHQNWQIVKRLTSIKENKKFKKVDKNGDVVEGIEGIIRKAKGEYGVKFVYMWHAITGYWGGVGPKMDAYVAEVKRPSIPRGVMGNEPCWESDTRVKHGIGVVGPGERIQRLYKDMHEYLGGAGVDGVKVDSQCILQTLGEGVGGRVAVTSAYHEALDESVARSFPGNGIIACMSHNTDSLYCSKHAAVVRASDDFFPRDPMSHSIHIATVAYNSVFLGEFMIPDWDMFHSLHPVAEFHASARAISGGPIYVSDEPGKHDFNLIRKLVLPDGSILRARLPGRPTLDCLFSDPSRDGVTLLKIWNMNKFNGVIGVYNCQGAAWSEVEKKTVVHQAPTEPLTTKVKSSNVHLMAEASTDVDQWNGDCAMYSHRGSELTILDSNATVSVSLKILEFEVFTVSPIKNVVPGVKFAPLGLIDMFNGGGAIDMLRYGGGEGKVAMEVKGCGRFGAYSSARPKECRVDSASIDYKFDPSNELLILSLDKMPEEGQFHFVEIQF